MELGKRLVVYSERGIDGVVIVFQLTDGLQMGKKTCPCLYFWLLCFPSHLNTLIYFTNYSCSLIKWFLGFIRCELKCLLFDFKNLQIFFPRRVLTLLNMSLIHVYLKNNRLVGMEIVNELNAQFHSRSVPGPVYLICMKAL